MRKQRDMSQIKQLKKTPENKLNEMEVSRDRVQNKGYKDAQKTYGKNG